MEAGESAAFVVAQAAGPLEAAQGDRQVNIDAYALGQSVLNVALIVCILKLKRRSEDRADTVDQRMEFLCDRIERLERKS
jgi:hypothetical protein